MKKKIVKKCFSAAVIALSLIVAFVACGTKADTEGSSDKGETQYKYGKIDIPGKDGALCAAPIYIAYEQGFFAEEGFDVTLISADTETRKIGLNNGTIPIVNGDFQFFPSIEEGVKVKVVDGLHNGCIKFIVPKDSPINNARDLKGKKIAVDEIGGTPHQVASVWLEKAGISAKQEDNEVTFVPYTDGNLEIESVKNGDVDVAALWDPLGSIAEQTGDFKVIFDLSTDPTFAGKYCCFLYASEKVLNEDPEKVAALLRAYNKAQNWIAENPKEAVDIIADKKYAAIEDKVLAEALVKSYAYPSAENHASGNTHIYEDVLYFVQELQSIGYLKTKDAAAFADQIYFDVKSAVSSN
ncbi:ABC transporter substrate-binding protein [Sinanaerobacter chloroacetimidivorans]|uniref:ABC transporter substrate-binding protein n=1 Tax=Sinanaerobacter chloroacetimidivorans TaxID=2818044 RepID=A0A8J8B2M7_9FIRM|nr:ABC transporter substrate-binding protein [Sinanaerobacter chloroacetimidivorans]MBR0599469.1 ABC transporter substrate-binding protein [Sinanaerobacter chloroacetimidivorans]